MNRYRASTPRLSLRIHPALALLAGATLCGALTACSSTPPGDHWVYFSSNSLIEVARFDAATGQISTPVPTSNVPGTNWITVDPSGRYMYATAAFADKPKTDNASGAVAAFSIDRKTGLLTLLNEQPTGGADPAHVVVDPTAHAVIVSNYAGGNITVLPIGQDGSLGAPVVTQHTGSSTDPIRQTKPYPHSAAFDPTGKFAYVQDLGTDKIVMYNFDASNAKLTPHDPPFQSVPGGNGPRHIAFDSSYKHAYLLTEMGKNIFVYDYDAASGNFTEKQHISSLSPDFKSTQSTAAEVLLSPNGKFLYASNRDLDAKDSNNGIGNIGAFAVDPVAGTLTPIGWTDTAGQIPRSFNIDPSGQWLLCGNQNSGTIVEFKINQATGALTPSGLTIKLESPFCEVFLPIQQ